LTLLGGTVVEDKLQEKVPETIKELKTAGIRIWILTGDKLESAKNIGYSSNLLSDQEKIFVLMNDKDISIHDFYQEMNNFSY
jgi:phospholipid-translocating ATPase